MLNGISCHEQLQDTVPLNELSTDGFDAIYYPEVMERCLTFL